jgi:hydrogenase maturation protein HypF
MWVEHMARAARETDCYPFPLVNGELDFRPLLQAVVRDRIGGRNVEVIARAFQRGIARGVADAARLLANSENVDTVVFSGGVFQNELLLEDIRQELENSGLQLWTNAAVPANDGGISLGQAALAALRNSGQE